jgi:surface antigen
MRKHARNSARYTAPKVGLMFVSAVVFAVLLIGCETMTHGDEGAVIGGVVGGVVGAQVGDGSGQTAAIIIGTIAGSMIGRHIGESMDDTDRMMTARTLNDNRTNESATWINPDTGYEYSVTPTKTYDQSGSPCREFTLNATVGGQENQDVYGTACLQADGSWLVQ